MSSTARTWSWPSTSTTTSQTVTCGDRRWIRSWPTSISASREQYQLPTASGNTLWSLGDNQNSVRDVVTDAGTPEQHIAYSPFGQQVSGLTTTGSVVANFAFGYTGTYTDPVTGFQLHGVRWYDPATSGG